MKRIAFYVFILVGIVSGGWAALAPTESDELNGQEAPLFSAKTLRDDGIALSDYKGKTVLLNFFASWCPPCRQEIAVLMKLHEKYAKDGLIVIGAATDSKLVPETSKEKEANDVNDLAKRLNIPYAITIANEDLVSSYKFKGIPTTIFINRDGKMMKVFYGYHKASQFEEIIQKMLSEKSAS